MHIVNGLHGQGGSDQQKSGSLTYGDRQGYVPPSLCNSPVAPPSPPHQTQTLALTFKASMIYPWPTSAFIPKGDMASANNTRLRCQSAKFENENFCAFSLAASYSGEECPIAHPPHPYIVPQSRSSELMSGAMPTKHENT